MPDRRDQQRLYQHVIQVYNVEKRDALNIKPQTIGTLFTVAVCAQAVAHTSEQSFVLLLPTKIYISAGVLAVLFTIVILAALPSDLTRKLFNSIKILPVPRSRHTAVVTSLLSLCLLLSLITVGFVGSHDPLKNLLPLTIWTVWWIGFIFIQGILGNLWRWLNPWSGLLFLASRLPLIKIPMFKLPESLGVWPAIAIYLLFSAFALADISPEDPQRLALIVSAYWLFTFSAMILFGEKWLQQGECFTVLLERIARLAPVAIQQRDIRIGLPGWQQLATPPNSLSAALLILTLLAVSSFDGINETFWWLAMLGINPLEFPGRSAVIVQTVSGLLGAVLLLVSVFAACIWLGTILANRIGPHRVGFTQALLAQSGAVLPIALAYHFAHFLTAFMVNIQYTAAAATDPLQNGRDLLGLGRFYVTTGFFNTQDTVRAIWLTQAGAVVLGHIFSVLMAHVIAERLWKSSRQAVLSQLPLSIFMVLYTLLGLWLLAAPRGA